MTFEEWARTEYDDDMNWQWMLNYEGDLKKAYRAGQLRFNWRSFVLGYLSAVALVGVAAVLVSL